MKKIFLIALAVAILFSLPLTAQAKVDFELGGYIRMDACWNSDQNMSHTLSSYVLRDNVLQANHGRFQMNANASRFNLTLKGPELWGGKITGFIECDFDGQDTIQPAYRNVAGVINNGWLATNDSSYNQAKLRLRHAMFKIVWPDREVLLGQYWSINSEMTPDTADSGAYCLYGATQVRIPQVRYTQKFGNGFDASVAIEAPQNGRWGLNVDASNPNEGELSETPMVEGKVRFEQDLYGKAGWYGAPRGFYVGLGGGYFRSYGVGAMGATGLTGALANTWQTLGQNNFQNNVAGQCLYVNGSQYTNHWLALIENFTPVIPTVSKQLAGTMGLAQQWWIGQGVSAWRLDLPGSDRYYTFNGNNGIAGGASYNLNFMKRYGGWVQLQYYFTNEIYTNVNFGFEKAFGFNNGRDISAPGGFVYANPTGYDPINSVWRAGVTQWWRPISAVKFAVQYTYSQTNYFQKTTIAGGAANVFGLLSNQGQAHTLFANAWYMF
jgi:hypothetical protein